jgi:hypothetical protein
MARTAGCVRQGLAAGWLCGVFVSVVRAPGWARCPRVSWSYRKSLPFCQFKLKRQPTQTNSRPRGGARYPHHSGKYPAQQGVIICSSPYTALVMAQCHHWSSYMGIWARIFSRPPPILRGRFPGLQGNTERSRTPAFLVTIFVRWARPARRAGRQSPFLISSRHCTRRLHRCSLAWTLTRAVVRSW